MHEPEAGRQDVTGGRASTSATAAGRRSVRREIVAVTFFAFAGLVILGLRLAGFTLYSLPSSSMNPTLVVGDYPVVLEYRPGHDGHSFLSELVQLGGAIWEVLPERGDVAVFRNPVDPSEKYIMRIVGLPGDRIQLRMGILHINGEPVKRERVEDFEIRPGRVAPQFLETLPGGRVHRIIEERGDESPFDETREYPVPDGHYFVLGDNRDNSQDSRFIGPIPAANLIGRAGIIAFSGDAAGMGFDRVFHGVE